ncbi:hypothetical protein Ple7327_1131 [Pleurocapsa sp. PCC 7327]|uniref:DUF6473 family protein n=1 Tax=Pleurocapsa sp. PCC 7327 TaxID=118163 RepID=UPI00029FA22E|nr:DUF6473 family protein [Pleurocapsa sp. PCC 7327]AFY76541.1 hypothetical protein Ple7327_1131 [Pleurocapsa sp. PCC 7327]
MQYQDRDWEIIDYQGFYLPNVAEKSFRGPKPEILEEGQYFVCLGAAQTFGCFCEKPYPTLLQEKLNIPTLNMGQAGAGPYCFLEDKSLLEYINKAKFAIIQVMSGRSESNSLFDSGGREYLTRLSDGVKIGADLAYKELIEQYDQNYVKKIVSETRANWVNNYQKLLQQIKVPKILFWFSTREPFYIEKYTNINTLFGRFPQLVNSKMVEQIKKYSDEYVKCITARGMPQLLISRFTGKPTSIDSGREDLRNLYGSKHMFNKYYPSPEMQIDAAKALEKVCKKYLFR